MKAEKRDRKFVPDRILSMETGSRKRRKTHTHTHTHTQKKKKRPDPTISSELLILWQPNLLC